MANLVSLSEIRDSFFTERIEIFTETPHFARIAVQVGPPPERIPNEILILRFGQPDTDETSTYFVVVTLDEEQDFFDIIAALGIGPDKAVWETVGANVTRKISANDAWKIKQNESFLLECEIPIKIEVAGYRIAEEDGSLSGEVGVRVHLASIEAEYVAPKDDDDLNNPIYDWSGELANAADLDVLTYDDISAAFEIDPDAKIWQIRDTLSAEEMRELIASSNAEWEEED